MVTSGIMAMEIVAPVMPFLPEAEKASASLPDVRLMKVPGFSGEPLLAGLKKVLVAFRPATSITAQHSTDSGTESL